MAPITVVVFYPLTQVGKRRGGVFLKTGVVAKKQKNTTEVSDFFISFLLFITAPLIVCLCPIFHRLSQTRVMPGLSIWLRSKSTKPISVVTTIRQGRWSSSFEKVEKELSEPRSSPECLYLSVHKHHFGIVYVLICTQLFFFSMHHYINVWDNLGLNYDNTTMCLIMSSPVYFSYIPFIIIIVTQT